MSGKGEGRGVRGVMRGAWRFWGVSVAEVRVRRVRVRREVVVGRCILWW